MITKSDIEAARQRITGRMPAPAPAVVRVTWAGQPVLVGAEVHRPVGRCGQGDEQADGARLHGLDCVLLLGRPDDDVAAQTAERSLRCHLAIGAAEHERSIVPRVVVERALGVASHLDVEVDVRLQVPRHDVPALRHHLPNKLLAHRLHARIPSDRDRNSLLQR